MWQNDLFRVIYWLVIRADYGVCNSRARSDSMCCSTVRMWILSEGHRLGLWVDRQTGLLLKPKYAERKEIKQEKVFILSWVSAGETSVIFLCSNLWLRKFQITVVLSSAENKHSKDLWKFHHWALQPTMVKPSAGSCGSDCPVQISTNRL